MADEAVSPSERMAAAFAKLRVSAQQINKLADELSKSVSQVEHSLERLRIRVAAWTLLHEWKGIDDDEFSREYLGYVEIGSGWRIVLRTSKGFESRPDQEDERRWVFDEAPQYLRIKAIDKLPELIEALANTVDKTAGRIEKRLPIAAEIAKATGKIVTVKLPVKS